MSPIVQPRGRRFGCDDLDVELRQISWLELEAGATLHVRLVAGQSPTVAAPLLPSAVMRPTSWRSTTSRPVQLSR